MGRARWCCHVLMHVHACTCIVPRYMCIVVRVYMYTHTHTHTSMQIHVHMYTCTYICIVVDMHSADPACSLCTSIRYRCIPVIRTLLFNRAQDSDGCGKDAQAVRGARDLWVSRGWAHAQEFVTGVRDSFVITVRGGSWQQDQHPPRTPAATTWRIAWTGPRAKSTCMIPDSAQVLGRVLGLSAW